MPPDSPLPCRTVQLRPLDDPDPSIQAHRHACASCGQAAGALKASWEALGLVTDRDPSPQFTARVMAKIERTSSRSRFALLRPLGSGAMRWTALAGGFAGVVLVASLLLHPERPQAPATGSEVVAELELLESQDLLRDLEVVEDLDLLLLMDEG